MSFRLKTVLGIAGIEIILLSILIVSSLHYLRVSNEQQLLECPHDSKTIATMTSDAVVAMDIPTIDVLINQTMKNSGIDFVRVRLANGTVVSESGNPNALRALSHKTVRLLRPTAMAGSMSDNSSMLVAKNSAESRSDSILGRLISFSEMPDNGCCLLPAWKLSLLVSSVFIFGRISTRQLMELQKGAQRVADGDLGHSIFVRGNDELSETAKSFNQMSRALAVYAGELETAKEAAEAGRDQAGPFYTMVFKAVPGRSDRERRRRHRVKEYRLGSPLSGRKIFASEHWDIRCISRSCRTLCRSVANR